MSLLACNDTTGLNASGDDNQGNIPGYSSKPVDNPIPIMDSRVLSYKKTWKGSEYSEYGVSLEYGSGFTDNENILKSWFPDIFNEESAKSECNYFALYFSTYSAPFDHHLILSQDMALHSITCNQDKGYYKTDDFIYETMLICDDKAGTLRKSIDLDSIRNYTIQDWDCQSGLGGPKPEDVFFDSKAQQVNPN
jgi:hypothetical protein